MGCDLKGKNLGVGISQRKDKYYIARFTSKHSGNRISKVFKTLPEAKLWLRDASYDEDHSVVTKKNVKQVTVNTWYDYWINEILGPRIKYSTRISYNGRYNNRIKPVIGDMLLNEVKPMDCQTVLNICMDQNDASGSISKIRSIMKKMFDSALENGWIVSNPVTSNVKYKHEKSSERRVFTVGEQELFKELVQQSSYKDVFIFILNTGLRIGELAGLKWNNVNLDNKTIYIDCTAYYNEETKTVEENAPKSLAGYRTIPLNLTAYEIVNRLYTGDQNKPYVFYNSAGNRIIEKEVNKALKRIVKGKMGIEERFTPHSLRHTFATRCAESGMKPKVLQTILGHEDISTTMNLYVHTTTDEIFSEMSKVVI